MAKDFAAHTPKSGTQKSHAAPPRGNSQPTVAQTKKPAEKPKEIGGPSGPEPTRYGDWERKGICVDF
jgi:hypothetical protein